MSWDVYVTGLVDVGNTTYNLGRMYSEALGIGLDELNNMPCSDALPILDKAIADMESRPEHHEQFNARNGWGTYDSALTLLKDLRCACEGNRGHIEVH